MTFTDTDRLPAYLLDAIDDEIDAEIESELAELWERFDAEIAHPWDDEGDMPIADIRLAIVAITHEATDLGADDLIAELDASSTALDAIEADTQRIAIAA